MILLDTCALIWSSEDLAISPDARTTILKSEARGELFLSPVSAWEVGLAVQRGRLRLHIPVEAWIRDVFGRSQVQVANITPQIAVRSCFLAGHFHADPADRFIVATAIEMGLKLITRDERMLRYGRQGYASVMAC